MKACVLCWNNYWQAEGPTWHLSVFRILWVPVHLYFIAKALIVLASEQHLPSPAYSFAPLLGEIPLGVNYGLLFIYFAGIYLLAIGYKTVQTRYVLATLASLLFFQTVSLYSNHLALFIVINWCMCFMPTKPGSGSLFAPRLVLLFTSFLYLFSAINKLDPAWQYRATQTPEITQQLRPWATPIWEALLQAQWAWLFSHAMVAWLFWLAIGIFVAHKHRIVAVAGVLLHGLFMVSFNDLYLVPFGWIMLCVWWLAAQLRPFTPYLKHHAKG